MQRLRLVALAAALLIALPAVAGQAAAPVLQVAPVSDIIEVAPEEATPVHRVPAKVEAPAPVKPAIMQDKGIEALGGVDAFLDLQSRAKAARPAAKVASAPSAAPVSATPKVMTQVDPRERPARPTTAVAGQVAAKGAPAPQRLDIQPHIAAADDPVLPYVLVPLSTDVVQVGSQGSISYKLLHDGSAVAGAIVRVPDLGVTAVTDSGGGVDLTVQAPDHNLQAGIYVTDGTNLTDAWLGEIYIVEPGFGVVGVSEFTDRDGTYVSNFWADFYNDLGTYERWSRQAKLGLILPAGTGKVVIGADRPTYGIQLTYSYSVTPGERANLHPTAEYAYHLQVQPTLEDAPVDSVVSLASQYIYGALPHRRSPNLYVNQGDYEVDVLVEAPLATYVRPVTTTVWSDMTLPVDIHDAEMAQFQYSGTDGYDRPVALPVVLQSWVAQVEVTNPTLPVKVFANRSYLPATAYGTSIATADASYSYRFKADHNWTWMNYGDIRPVTLGGPVHVNMLQRFSNPRVGDMLLFDTSLQTGGGDSLAVSVTRDGTTAPLTGTFRLRDGAGNVLSEQTVTADTQTVSVRLPSGVGGTYTASLDYDLGPYQGAVHGETAFSVYAPPVLTVSPEIVKPFVSNSITMTLTAAGQPCSGATLSLGWGREYGSYTANAAGQVTFVLPPVYGDEAIPIYVNTGSFYGYRGYVYVVPDGWGAVAVRDVTDQNGLTVRSRALTLTAPGQFGSMIHSGWAFDDEYFGSVAPAGTAQLEVASDNNGTGLFIYKEVTVQAGKRVDVTPSGAGAKPLDVSATINGVPLGGARVYLHNRAMSDSSRYANDVPTHSYVTPGTYDLLLESTDPSALLYRSGVNVQAPATVTITEYSEGLAGFDEYPRDGYGYSLNSFYWFGLQVGSIEFTKYGWTPRHFQVTPGIPMRPISYALTLTDGQSHEIDYMFAPAAAGDLTPAPGQTAVINAGGPLALGLVVTNYGLGIPGEKAVEVSLQTSEGHYLSNISTVGTRPTGTLQLQNSAGATLWSGTFTAGGTLVGVPWPTEPGTYSLVADVDLSPYQGPVHGETTFTVDAPLTVALSVDHVPTGVRTPVTVTVTSGAQTVAGVAVDMDNGYYQGTTDANGQVTFQVLESSSRELPVRVNSHVGAYLFALAANYVGIDLFATDEYGQPLYNFSATVESASSYSYTSISSGGDGRGAAVAPAGTLLVSLATWYPAGYFLNQTVQAAGGTVQRVHLDGAAAVAIPFTATLDGGPISGSLELRPVSQREAISEAGLTLSPAGSAVARVTPGAYAALVRSTQPDGELVGLVREVSLTGQPVSLNFQRSQLGAIEISMNRGAPAGALRMLMLSEGFEVYFYAPVGRILATPGTYAPTNLWYYEVQADGAQWRYHLHSVDLQYQVAAGQTVGANWDMTIASSKVDTRSSVYDPGDRVFFHLLTQSVSGWEYDEICQTSPGFRWVGDTKASITDADGTEVYTDTDSFFARMDWAVPANPSSSYTITMHRDMGTEGVQDATKTITRRQPAVLRTTLEIIPVGQATTLGVMLLDGGRPTPGTISIGGQQRRTDGRGQATLQVKPYGPGAIEVCGTVLTSGQTICSYIYALRPDMGLLDVQATDADGGPLDYTLFTSTSGSGGGRNERSGYDRKAIVPAGLQQVVVQGAATNADLYYQVLSVNVPAMGAVTATADGALTQPIPVRLAGLDSQYYAALYLRRTDLDYVERTGLSLASYQAFTLHASPGAYEYLLGTEDWEGSSTILSGNFVHPDAGSLTLNAGDATAALKPTLHDGSGQELTGARVWLGVGYGRIEPHQLLSGPMNIKPGAYRLMSTDSLLPNETDAAWHYDLDGNMPLTLSEGEVRPLVLGGPLHLQATAPAQVLANGKGVIQAAPLDANGMRLRVYDLTSNAMLPIQAEITGPGGYVYATRLDIESLSLTWSAPATPGRYTYHVTFAYSGYGPTLEATGTIDVIRLSPPRR